MVKDCSESMVRVLVGRLLVFAWMYVSIGPSEVYAQGAPEVSRPRRLIDVRRRQVELQNARAELGRIQKLRTEGFSSIAELDRAKVDVERTQLEYQASVLDLLDTRPILTVRRAVKEEDESGRKHVRITVANLTRPVFDSELEFLGKLEGLSSVPEEFRTAELRGVLLSLKETGGAAHADDVTAGVRGTTVALPYEYYIEELPYNASKTIKFQLLRDVDRIIVSMQWRQYNREVDVLLQRARTERPVEVRATELSQEADLGKKLEYDISLERSTLDSQGFYLKTLNLPPQVQAQFLDPSNEARVSQILFPSGVSRKDMKLVLYLPERSDVQLPVDRPLRFFVVAHTDAQRAGLDESADSDILKKSKVGWIELELIPRGVGEIEVNAPSLFAEAEPGEAVETFIEVKNSGTRRLDNVRIWTEHPSGWTTKVAPELIPALEKDESMRVQLRVVPPSRVEVGDYETRIKTESYAYNRLVESEDKIYRLSIKARSNGIAIAVILVFLLALVGTTIVVATRLNRR